MAIEYGLSRITSVGVHGVHQRTVSRHQCTSVYSRHSIHQCTVGISVHQCTVGTVYISVQSASVYISVQSASVYSQYTSAQSAHSHVCSIVFATELSPVLSSSMTAWRMSFSVVRDIHRQSMSSIDTVAQTFMLPPSSMHVITSLHHALHHITYALHHITSRGSRARWDGSCPTPYLSSRLRV